MRRAILLFTLGIFCAALMSTAFSAYIFHDVDSDQVGRWNEAFAGLCVESVLFALIIGGAVAFLTLLGRQVFHLKGYSPRAIFSFLVGVGVTVFQYPWEFAAKKEFPSSVDSARAWYFVVAMVLCSFVIICATFKQMKSRQGPVSSVDN